MALRLIGHRNFWKTMTKTAVYIVVICNIELDLIDVGHLRARQHQFQSHPAQLNALHLRKQVHYQG